MIVVWVVEEGGTERGCGVKREVRGWIDRGGLQMEVVYEHPRLKFLGPGGGDGREVKRQRERW